MVNLISSNLGNLNLISNYLAKMCVYHYEDSKRAERWIWFLLLGTVLFSVGVSVPMFILTYPGDECLLFVSVRGEALIYGNPAGCNFIAYGHCQLILSGKILLMFLERARGASYSLSDYH